MKGHGTKFQRKKDAAIAALLTQRNIDEAARAVGIAPNTLLSWMKNGDFAAAYLEARRAAVSQAIARVQQTTGAAVSTMQKLMVDLATPAAVKARVAEAFLAIAIKGIETEDIEVRVSELERASEASQQRR